MVTFDRAKKLLSPFGILKPQPLSDWAGPFPLPAQLGDYYRYIGPMDLEIPGYGNPYCLPSLEKLWDFQAGYRFDGFTRERIAEWDDDWIAIADEGGDPFIFSRRAGEILYAQHGQGYWEPEPLFSDITTLVACLGALGCVVDRAGLSLSDEDGFILPEHRETAKNQLLAWLESEEDAAIVLAVLGWGL